MVVTSDHSTITTTSQRTSTSTKNTSVDDRAFDPTTKTTTTAQDLDSQGDLLPDSEKPPSSIDLDAAGHQLVWTADGAATPFRELISGNVDDENEKEPGGTKKKRKRVLVIFVRHFFCGNCQEYLRTLSQFITPDSLLPLFVPTSIIIIGCGSPDLIPMYTETTGCRFPIYADPSRKIFQLLGMTRTLSLGPARPDYMRRPLLANMVLSIFQGIKSGRGAIKGGDVKQVGGEFLFDDGNLVWCHRMKNTRDHGEIPVLKQVLGFGLVKEDAEGRKESTN